MYVQIRGGNIQQMGSWHFRPFAIFGPNFLFPAAKDCTLKTAARSNFEFSFPRYGKWLIPQLSFLHEISQTWACNDFLAYSCWMSESRFPVPKKIESLFSSRLPPFWYVKGNGGLEELGPVAFSEEPSVIWVFVHVDVCPNSWRQHPADGIVALQTICHFWAELPLSCCKRLYVEDGCMFRFWILISPLRQVAHSTAVIAPWNFWDMGLQRFFSLLYNR